MPYLAVSVKHIVARHLHDIPWDLSRMPSIPFRDAQSPILALQLVGNKVDMSHLRAVKSERHTSFAEMHGMHQFFVSAKTGDNVSTCFYRVASDLAGITLTKPEVMYPRKGPEHTSNRISPRPRPTSRAHHSAHCPRVRAGWRTHPGRGVRVGSSLISE